MTEPYGLQYAGREAARRLALRAPAGTLAADRTRSWSFDDARDVLIEGDNLAVMAGLVPAYAGRVDMAYLDPPYNTGRDFVYRDKFAETKADYVARTRPGGGEGEGLVANPETSGRFHSRWLAMMEPRLRLVHRLLGEHGLVFVSIDDHEVAQLRLLLDDIFGVEGFVAQIVVVTNRGGRDYLRIATGHEYLLVYGKRPDAAIRPLPRAAQGRVHEDARGPFELRELRNRNPRFSPANRPNLHYPVWVDPTETDDDGLAAVHLQPGPGRVEVRPHNSRGEAGVWRWGRPKLAAGIEGEVSDVVARQKRDGGINVYEKYRKTTTKPRALWDESPMRTEQGTRRLRQLLGVAAFDHPKPVELVARCLRIGMASDGLVLDPFAGSGTTADAVAQLDAADGGRRRSLSIQLPQRLAADAPGRTRGWATIADITVARVRAAFAEHDRGLRVFTHVPGPAPAAWRDEVVDGADYLRRLAQAEARRGDRDAQADPWELARAAGLGLDAAVRPAADLGWWMDAPDGEVLVVTAARFGAEALAALDPPRGTRLVCHASAYDDAAAAWIVARGLSLSVGA